LYRLLRKTEHFSWTPEAEEALGNLKALLTSAPILVPPAAGEALLIYVAATTQVVSAAIIVERREEGHALLVQRPVYFISEVLSETKIRYPQIQKLLYAVILTRRKLRHYFKSHPVTVVSSFPLGEIIQCREASGRIAKWAVEIMGETISFAPWKAIKSQEPKARSAGGTDDAVGGETFSGCHHLSTDDSGHLSTNTAPASGDRPKAHRQVLTPVLDTRTRTGPSQNTSTALAAYDVLCDPPVQPATVARAEDGMLHPGQAAAVCLPPHG
jgi:hypothetical protein